MKHLYRKQCGFAAPAMFVAVIIAFVGSLGVENDKGITIAESMGIVDNPPKSEFAAMESEK